MVEKLKVSLPISQKVVGWRTCAKCKVLSSPCLLAAFAEKMERYGFGAVNWQLGECKCIMPVYECKRCERFDFSWDGMQGAYVAWRSRAASFAQAVMTQMRGPWQGRQILFSASSYELSDVLLVQSYSWQFGFWLKLGIDLDLALFLFPFKRVLHVVSLASFSFDSALPMRVGKTPWTLRRSRKLGLACCSTTQQHCPQARVMLGKGGLRQGRPACLVPRAPGAVMEAA